MAYIGASPYTELGLSIPALASFNGDGSTVVFTLPLGVSFPHQLEVTVNNVQQAPLGVAYTVSNLSLTFSEAPSAGSNNIIVIYRV